ncbi:acyloxyacyl hydrolase [Chlorobium phaeovibrioides]|uniref:Acyloxyacyl hydrolase n=1 Tax=Chlorobium phaeovibrioides TaxID=1094 RepID=A0A432AVX2_CHLPH|nr:acyloxyacyl hydrolase [Chlorobium phaeovibrioides]RTY38420.1 acyloxyacyl hydrolase [Chlorobium phaeovibrioides]
MKNLHGKFIAASLLLTSLFLSPLQTHAESRGTVLHEYRIGIMAHDTDINLWGAAPSEQGIDFNGELIFTPEWEVLGGIARPNLGMSINSAGDTSYIYSGGLWEYQWKNGVFFDAAVGLSANNESGKDLGSAVLLRLALEVGYNLSECNRMSLMMDHISNANTADPNPGIDNIGIRFGHLF